MKKVFVITCLALLASCNKKMYSPNVTNDSTTEEGTIRIHANGIGNNEKTAYQAAVQNAFSRLLFQGIPESVQSTPMIPDETAARRQHGATLDCFKDAGCYTQFITRGGQQGGKTKVKGGGIEAESDVTINVRAVRAYLEKNNVIRKFGF